MPAPIEPPALEWRPVARLPLVVMGVSGSGKTIFGGACAAALTLPFVDGDDLHSQGNIDKMRRAQPLTDDDREPWLRAIVSCLADASTYGQGVVVACSALKVAYRDTLRRASGVRFIFLEADRASIEARLRARTQHFMPAALLESQFAALELPTSAEPDILTLPGTMAPALAVRAALEELEREGLVSRRGKRAASAPRT